MLNKVTLIGNVGKDPETRTFQNGGKVCNFTLATSETWKKDGEKQTKTQWHNIAIFNEHIRHVVESYVKKGSKIYIEGQLETRKWEQNGENRYSTEVVLKAYKGELTLLDSRSEATQNGVDKASLSLASDNSKIDMAEELNDEIPF